MAARTAPPTSIADVLDDYKARQSAIIRALTTDFERLFNQCVPEKGNLCLYGHPDGRWEVTEPAKAVPPDIPEPVLGINYAREGISHKQWRTVLALYSDAWLISVSTFFMARFNRKVRRRVFDMIIELPTVNDIVGQFRSTQSRRTSAGHDASKVELSGEMGTKRDDETLTERGKKQDVVPYCAVCGAPYVLDDEFWIICDSCQRWHHCKCLNITPGEARCIKNYSCLLCRVAGKRNACEKVTVDDQTLTDRGKKQDALPNCAVCGAPYVLDDEFWIICDFCQRWHHCKCLNITPVEARYIKNYSCLLCRADKHNTWDKMTVDYQTLTDRGKKQDALPYCAVCGAPYLLHDELWIICDFCQRLHHCKCLNITPGEARFIKNYSCLLCRGEQPNPHDT